MFRKEILLKTVKELIDAVSALPNENIFSFISICVSFINIITTVFLAAVNLFFIQRNRKKDNINKALLEYYFPLKYKIISLRQEMDTFKTCYGIQTDNLYEMDANTKQKIAEKYLKPYLQYYNSLPKYCLFTEVDTQIIQLNQYYTTIIYILGMEDSVDILKLKEMYPECNVNNVIESIDKVIKKL